MRPSSFALAALAALAAGPAAAPAGPLTLIDVPGAGFTRATGISNGTVVGYYGTGSVFTGLNYNGFIYDQASGTFTTVSVSYPGQSLTLLTGISGHTVSGYYMLSAGGPEAGFTYDTVSHIFTPLPTPPGLNGNLTTAGTDGTNVAGSYVTGGVWHAFVYTGSSYKDVSIPGSTATFSEGVSGHTLVGTYDDGGGTHGFVYDTIANTYTTLDHGALTALRGIDGGDIVGDSFGTGAFVYDSAAGTFTPIGVPGATHTTPHDMSGPYVVGEYNDAAGHTRAFLMDTRADAAAVPAPPAVALLGMGVLSLCGYGWRRRRAAVA